MSLRKVDLYGAIGIDIWRSSAPGYRHDIGDEPHDISESGLLELQQSGCLGRNGLYVISLNSQPLIATGRQRLKVSGVFFLHLPVDDFHPPSREQQAEATALIRRATTESRNVLIYCGAGFGRTGTLLAAYEIVLGQRHDPDRIHALGVESPDQRLELRRLAQDQLH